MESVFSEVVSQCVRRLKEAQQKINLSLEKLSEDQCWWRPNQVSNSVGNIVLHLCGNLTQYVLSGIKGEPDLRQRSLEFSENGPIAKTELLIKFNAVMAACLHTIENMTESDGLRIRPVQCYEESGLGILIHVTEHLTYHTGQIVYFTKWQEGRSMNFYDDDALQKHGK